MSVNLIPELLNSFRVFEDGNDQLGIADITLPSLEYLTETIKGAGMAGEVDAPVTGQLSSTTVTFNWRVLNKSQLSLMSPGTHHLDCRGALQFYDSGTGETKIGKCRVVVRGRPKKSDLGKFETAAKMDGSTEIEATYIKVVVDGETYAEIDKYSSVCVMGGVDYMADIRSALGLD